VKLHWRNCAKRCTTLTTSQVTTSHEVHNFKAVTRGDCRLIPRSTRKNVCVSLDRHATSGDAKVHEQAGDAQPRRYAPVISIYDDGDGAIYFIHYSAFGMTGFEYWTQTIDDDKFFRHPDDDLTRRLSHRYYILWTQ
jgi:hypothetical protein